MPGLRVNGILEVGMMMKSLKRECEILNKFNVCFPNMTSRNKYYYMASKVEIENLETQTYALPQAN